jgi:GT2 family glycosyltransferase
LTREAKADVSVVIPTLDGEDLLPTQLEALSDQEFDGALEVLVVDNGSTDRTVPVAREWERRLTLQVIDGSARRGQAHARNLGGEAASSDKLLFLDQDDQVQPGYVAAMALALDTHPLVAARLHTGGLNDAASRSSREPAHGDDLVRTDFLPWAYGCTLGVRREVFRALGGFRHFGGASEDIDFCWRAQVSGSTLTLVPEAVLEYRLVTRPSAMAKQAFRYGRSGARLYRHYRADGMHRSSLQAAARTWGAGLVHLATGPNRHAALVQVANRAGRAVGSVEQRVLFP